MYHLIYYLFRPASLFTVTLFFLCCLFFASPWVSPPSLPTYLMITSPPYHNHHKHRIYTYRLRNFRINHNLDSICSYPGMYSSPSPTKMQVSSRTAIYICMYFVVIWCVMGECRINSRASSGSESLIASRFLGA